MMLTALLHAMLYARLAASGWLPMGPFGGAASFVVADPHAPGTFLAAANNGLLFRSENRGDSWQPIRFPPQLRGILHVLAIDPSKPDTYYAGMAGEGVSGLWRSADAGRSWESLTPLEGNEVWALAFYPGPGRAIAAGTKTGVFLSSDDGANWRRISPAQNRELQPVVSLAFDPRNRKVIYAGTPHLPWATRDGGASWQSIHAGMLDDSDVFSIQVDHHNSRRVLATACSGIYSSANAGALWRKLRGAQGASYRTYFIVQHPQKSGVLFAGTTRGLVKSEDAGLTWKQLSSHTTRALAFDPSEPERVLVATDDAGLLRSDKGGAALRHANQGYCNRHLTVLASGGGGLYTSTMYDASGGLFRLDNPGNSTSGKWTRLASPAGLPGQQFLALTQAAGAQGRLYAAGFHTLALSSDSGRRWTPIEDTPVRSLITSLLSVPTPSPQLLVGTENGLFRRDAAGAWRKIDLTGAARIRGLFDLAAQGIAALTAPQAFLSKDGSSFSALAKAPPGVEIHGLADVQGILLAATSHGVLRSADKGRSWTLDTGGVQGTVNAICADPNRPGVAYAAHYGEVYVIHTTTRLWRRVSPEHSAIHSIKNLTMLPGVGGHVLALTNRQGVFALDVENSGRELGINKY
ncbi:MAG: hypothetical protein SFV51_00460 [Bryobacteraceae bacterium]|nr:hypothetical protein [Bryobacteraceae bacterium]